jgi:ABC-type phosphate/phosphonate transport system ATPase subunit
MELKIENLSKTYSNGVQALKNVSLKNRSLVQLTQGIC